jgi:zinc transport system ATP-binding protein
MSHVIVQISNLSFAFGALRVLESINLTIQRGSTVGVIGPNGGGKTTLIRLILGLLEPSTGTILVEGVEPAQAVRRGNVVGYLPQRPSVLTDMPLSVQQVVRLGLSGKTGMFRPVARDDLMFADALLERVGLADLRHQPVGRLSGGQLQRVLIARALAPRPRLLLLDERPGSNVSSSSCRACKANWASRSSSLAMIYARFRRLPTVLPVLTSRSTTMTSPSTSRPTWSTGCSRVIWRRWGSEGVPS